MANATPTAARKLTAANTPALARVKALFNAKIYKTALGLANGPDGLPAAREYIGRWFNDECRAERLRSLFAELDAVELFHARRRRAEVALERAGYSIGPHSYRGLDHRTNSLTYFTGAEYLLVGEDGAIRLA